MKRGLWAVGVVLAVAVLGAQQDTINRYCVSCHNDRLKTSGLSLEKADASRPALNPELWESVARKLQARSMPPQNARRPDEATYQSLQTQIERALDAEAVAHPNPGAPILHRLNRSEYANAIHDLLALDVDVASLLPPDDAAFGFDNISDVLGVSPSLQERYLSAAMKIAAVAVGNPDITAGSDTFRIRQDLSQDQHIDGLPLGTIGGTSVRYTFPLDGDYVFQVKLYRTNLNIMRGLEYAHDVEFAVDGKRVYLATIGGTEDLASLFDKPTDTSDAVDARLRVRVPVTAGPHTVSVAFVEDAPVQEPSRLQPFLRSSIDNFDWAGRPHMQTFTITGPFNATAAGDTPSRRKIFSCSAKALAERCAEKILSTIAHRAYRGPVSPVDLQRILKIYREGSRSGSFERGIEAALVRILAAPRFVFRVERDPATARPGSAYNLSDVELASRLSFFLWSSIPDDELLAVAEQGRLKDRAVLDAQVRRMLADPKSKAIVDNFAGQWLQLRNVRNVQPNSDLYPDFDDNLRMAFKRETELFFESVMREDRPVLDLMTANYTFINERLAKHYGIRNIYGSRFRRVTLTDERRFGLLGKGSVLTVTSHAERTSPVERGKWVLDNILAAPVPPPPPIPGAGVFADPVPGEMPKSMREQMVEHRKNPVCASCHNVMDPIGLSLENFDVDGSWRAEDGGAAIDATGQLVDGTRVDGVVTLRKALVAHPDVFQRAITEKLLIYALGRGLDARDMPAVRAIMREAAGRDYRFQSLVLAVVHSTPFTMRLAQPALVASR